MTAQGAIKYLKSSNTQEQLTALREIVQAGSIPELYDVPELYDITVANLSSPEGGVVFFSLDILIKKYPLHLQKDAQALTPKLLCLLTSRSVGVADRAIWALNITGENSLPELVKYITKATDDFHQVMYIHALSRNGYIRQHPAIVVATLRAQLESKNFQVQFAAADALMSMSPLINERFPVSPNLRLSAGAYDFEPVYVALQRVYKTLLETQTETKEPDHAQWLIRQLELLENRNTDE